MKTAKELLQEIYSVHLGPDDGKEEKLNAVLQEITVFLEADDGKEEKLNAVLQEITVFLEADEGEE